MDNIKDPLTQAVLSHPITKKYYGVISNMDDKEFLRQLVNFVNDFCKKITEPGKTQTQEQVAFILGYPAFVISYENRKNLRPDEEEPDE